MNFTIRLAEKKDMQSVIDLITELAVFEKEPDAVEITVADLVRDGFSGKPMFQVFVAEQDNKIIGINNRNLKTFEVDLEHSMRLANQIPTSAIKISESGISDPRIITGLKEFGFQGFLIGENFMKEEHPGIACEEFISQIR